MKIKLFRSVLVEDADVAPTRGGTVVAIDTAKAREFIALGLAEEVKGDATVIAVKKTPEPSNKMAAAPKNKSASAQD